MNYIRFFNELTINDVPLVGGKAASLGQMYTNLSGYNICVPNGFALTADAYWHFLDANNLRDPLLHYITLLHTAHHLAELQKIGNEIRSLILSGIMPEDLSFQINKAYKKLTIEAGGYQYAVAVRSSATAEDLPNASFAGQQETFLNIKDEQQLELCCIKSFASLFTDRAIAYRQEKGFDHSKIALSVVVQRMVRSDVGCSGVLFTLDTESGFKDVIMINAAPGLGELIVQGLVDPDEYWIFKSTLKNRFKPIIQKKMGNKVEKMVYGTGQGKAVEVVATSTQERDAFCLHDDEIIELANSALVIEEHYSNINGYWTPMDIEWAYDGLTKKLYILQARPETIHAHKQQKETFVYELMGDRSDYATKLIAVGQSIGTAIATGPVKYIESIENSSSFKPGDILVTRSTDPDWVPLMKQAGGLITQKGGRTSHAAIVSRELGLPAIVGVGDAFATLVKQDEITLDCSQGLTGFVFAGKIPFARKKINLTGCIKPPVNIYVNCADPDRAFSLSLLPVDGVGLVRIEFIITNRIKIHPMVAVKPDIISDTVIQQKVERVSRGYKDVQTFFVDTLAQGIATIAAAFYPKSVVVRFSDFKSNEYRNLIGGLLFEPVEENPMLGLRGAARYYNDLYKEAFKLECQAIVKVRNEMGLSNCIPMVPFVRTVAEAEKVIRLLNSYGITSGIDGLKMFMMAETPSNALLIEQFADFFDGFSIGSNDLTQFTLAVDRDSELITDLFDEQNEAVKKMIVMMIDGAKKSKKLIGICGQAPSDHLFFAQFLIDAGIDSLSLNPDSILPFLNHFSGSANK